MAGHCGPQATPECSPSWPALHLTRPPQGRQSHQHAWEGILDARLATGCRTCSDFPKPFHTGAWWEPQRLHRPEKQIKENPDGEELWDPARATPTDQYSSHGACLTTSPLGRQTQGLGTANSMHHTSPQPLRDRFWIHSSHDTHWVGTEDGAGSALLVPSDLLWQKRKGRQARSRPFT